MNVVSVLQQKRLRIVLIIVSACLFCDEQMALFYVV